MNKKLSYAMMSFLMIPCMILPQKSMYLGDEVFRSELISGTMIESEDPSISAAEPVKIEWSLLIDIDYNLKYLPDLDASMYEPVFSKAVKALNGKEVIIEGYVIPLDESGNELALSANPFSSCFFCGEASPASIMGIYLQKKGKKFRTDEFRSFRGKLKLNSEDPEEFYYSLVNASVE